MVVCDRCHRKFTTYSSLRQHYSNQHPNAKWPDSLQDRLTDEERLQGYRATLRPTRSSHVKPIIAIVFIVIVIGAASVYLPAMFRTSPGTNPACANFPFPPNGAQDLAEHFHALLLIYVNGQQVNLPLNIGDGDYGSCTQPLHVHTNEPTTNVIHIESPTMKDYTLGDFFNVWAATPDVGGPKPVVFSQNQIFNYTAGNGYELRMYVNGQQSSTYNSLVLRSHLIIVIVYGNSLTDWSYYQNLSAQQWTYSGY